MQEYGLNSQSKVMQRGHVIDSVMDEHYIEGTLKSQRSHVSYDVLAVGIESEADREHLRRDVRQGHMGKACLEIEGIIAAATAKLE